MATRPPSFDEFFWRTLAPKALTRMSAGVSVLLVLLAVWFKDEWYGALFASGAFVAVVIAAYDIWAAERLRVVDLENRLTRPERISLVALAKVAEENFGWNFQSEEDLMFFDFIDGLRHALNDDDFELEGRLGCMDHPEDRKNFYFLELIPKGHVKNTQIVVPGFLKGETSNYETHTWSYSDDVLSKDLYRDIHVSNRAKAIAWLQAKGNDWKGQRVKANEIREARTAQHMRELREQSVTHTVEDGTMQGRVWKLGDPPEGKKVC
jgi:hypothetical protein